jgi:hypothetical protein
MCTRDSVGAAWVARSILAEPKPEGARDVIDRVTAKAIYWRPERPERMRLQRQGRARIFWYPRPEESGSGLPNNL